MVQTLSDIPPPQLSHALSDCTEGVWKILSAESGELVALVADGAVILAEDIKETSGLGFSRNQSNVMHCKKFHEGIPKR